MRNAGILFLVLVLCFCDVALAAGPCGEEAIVISVRNEYSKGYVYETDGHTVRTLSYEYVKGLGWKGADGSVYTRTENGWVYVPPETAKMRI